MAPKSIITKKSSRSIDYQTMKNLFEAFSKPLAKTYNRKNVSNLIRKYSTAFLNLKPETQEQLDLLNRYEVVKLNGQAFLALKRKKTDSESKNLIVFPIEEVFDLLVDVHIATLHGQLTAMSEKLKDNCNVKIPKPWISLFLECCNVCRLHRKTLIVNRPLNTYDNVTIYIYSTVLELAPYKADYMPFPYVLVYLIQDTKFTLIRPLTAYAEDEVALEIFKIFTDQGIPRTISTYRRGFFEVVFYNYLKALWPECPKIPIERISPWKMPSSLAAKLRRQKQLSMYYWPFLSYITQYELNTTKHSVNRTKNMAKSISIHFGFGLKGKSRKQNQLDLLEDDEKKDEDTIPLSNFIPQKKLTQRKEKFTCSVCSGPLFAPKICNFCNNTVHFFCADRQKSESGAKLELKCRHCTKVMLASVFVA